MPRADVRLRIAAGALEASVLPGEGGVLVELRRGGVPVLAATPWADAVVASAEPAPDEATWVGRWRGGWQVNLPSAGASDRADARQGFHGAASQAPWHVLEARADAATLRWSDADGLVAERSWTLAGDAVTARTTLRNAGTAARRVVIAEHLVLGGAVLDGPLRLETDALGLQPLDYAGFPAGVAEPWPGAAAERWTEVDAATPARVGGLVGASAVTATGPHAEVAVRWTGLPHALVWEELAVSTEAPWNGEVRALGLEPSSVPHGAGTAAPDATVLAPGAELMWQATLEVRRLGRGSG